MTELEKRNGLLKAWQHMSPQERLDELPCLLHFMAFGDCLFGIHRYFGDISIGEVCEDYITTDQKITTVGDTEKMKLCYDIGQAICKLITHEVEKYGWEGFPISTNIIRKLLNEMMSKECH